MFEAKGLLLQTLKILASLPLKCLCYMEPNIYYSAHKIPSLNTFLLGHIHSISTSYSFLKINFIVTFRTQSSPKLYHETFRLKIHFSKCLTRLFLPHSISRRVYIEAQECKFNDCK
jgi:hypothetical protein